MKGCISLLLSLFSICSFAGGPYFCPDKTIIGGYEVYKCQRGPLNGMVEVEIDGSWWYGEHSNTAFGLYSYMTVNNELSMMTVAFKNNVLQGVSKNIRTFVNHYKCDCHAKTMKLLKYSLYEEPFAKGSMTEEFIVENPTEEYAPRIVTLPCVIKDLIQQ